MYSDYPRTKWNQRFRDKQAKLNISHHNYAHVVHTTAKQIISRRGKNRNVFEISKDEKCMAKRKNYCFSLLNMQMCGLLQFYKGSRGVYHKCANLIYFFCINILITNKNPYMRQLLLQITVWEVKGARNGKTVHD